MRSKADIWLLRHSGRRGGREGEEDKKIKVMMVKRQLVR
jgi:hypothetical protein